MNDDLEEIIQLAVHAWLIERDDRTLPERVNYFGYMNNLAVYCAANELRWKGVAY